MGLCTTVALVRGIDYGDEKTGSSEAWAWHKSAANPYETVDGCASSIPNGGDESAARLVLYLAITYRPIYATHEVAASTVNVSVIVEAADTFDDVLLARCDALGLPRRAVRWLVMVDRS